MFNETSLILKMAIRVMLFGLVLFWSQVLYSQSPMAAFHYSNTDSIDDHSAPLAKNRAVTAEKGVVASWNIEIDPGLKLLDKGNIFTIPLPSGGSLQATVEERNERNNGDIQIQANILGGGAATFTIGVNVTYASISSDSLRFSIGMDDDVDLSDDVMMPPDLLKQRLSTSTDQLRSFALPSNVTSGASNIDVLVVYNSEFADVFSSPQTRINQLLAFSNTSFSNSGILINLRLAAAVEVDFDNNNSVSTNLTNATNGTGSFANLAALRDQHGADLVAVMSVNLVNQFSANGIAWLNANNDRFAFSATRLSANCCDSVFTHEIGHNLGSGHEYTAVNPSLPTNNQCSGGFTGFSCGHGNSTNNWGTIMSNYGISAKAAVNFVFSNLDAECVGSPCGVAQGSTNAADNRTSFNMTRLTVANFRDEVVTDVSITPVTPPIPNNTELGWVSGIITLLLDGLE